MEKPNEKYSPQDGRYFTLDEWINAGLPHLPNPDALERQWHELPDVPYPDSTAATLAHIREVNRLLLDFAQEIIRRAQAHDASKLTEPEKTGWDRAQAIQGLTYGSPEYYRQLQHLPLAAHYAANRHHPEHHAAGINDMSLVDIVEMFCDWQAAVSRHADGNILRSIELNQERFGLAPQLVNIFRNSLPLP